MYVCHAHIMFYWQWCIIGKPWVLFWTPCYIMSHIYHDCLMRDSPYGGDWRSAIINGSIQTKLSISTGRITSLDMVITCLMLYLPVGTMWHCRLALCNICITYFFSAPFCLLPCSIPTIFQWLGLDPTLVSPQPSLIYHASSHPFPLFQSRLCHWPGNNSVLTVLV